MNIEVGLVSKIKTKEDFLLVLEERIKEDFFEEHEEVFLAISSHFGKYKNVPEQETLQKAFPNFQFYEGEEPLQFFIDKIKEQYKKKLFNTTLPKVAELLPTDVDAAEKILQGLLSASKNAIRTGSILDSRHSVESRISVYEQREAQLGIDGFSTSWNYLDNLTCGFHPGELIILMGRAKMGKSWLLTWLMQHIWKEHNVPEVYVTKEMGDTAIQWRFDAINCNMPYDGIRHGTLTPAQKQKYHQQIISEQERMLSGELAPYAIRGFDLTDGSSGISAIVPQVEQYLGDGGVLFVDGIYLMPDDRGEKDWKGIVNVAMDLKILAQTYNIPIVVTTQQSMEDKSDVPRLENAAYGKYIVQYADLILGIGRSSLDRESNRGNIYILGQREGDIGSFGINMKFDPIDFSERHDKYVSDDDYDENEEVYRV